MNACLGTGMAVNCNSLGASRVEEWGWVRRARRITWTLKCITHICE